MNWRKTLIVLAAGILTLMVSMGIFMALKKSHRPPEQKPLTKTIRMVQSELVQYTTQNSTLEATGRILSQQSVELIAEVQGKLLPGDVPLKAGQEFRAGDVLARIYDRDTRFALQARKSAYLNALANILPDLKMDYPEAYTAWVDFFNTIDLENPLPPFPEVNAPLKIFLSSRGVLTEYYGIRADEERLKKYTLLAPYNGAIQNVLLETGSVANPGSHIAQILKTDQLEIEMPLDTRSSDWIHKGDLARIYSENGIELGTASVVRMAQYIDPQTQSINSYLKVQNSSGELRAGGYVRVEFNNIRIAHAMEIPRNAVFNQNLVFVIDSGMLMKQEINLLKIGQNTVVFNGPDEGTEIVTEPLANAQEKMQVQSKYTRPPQSDTEPATADSTKNIRSQTQN